MTQDELPEPPRQVAHFLLLVAVAFLIIASVALSGRPVLRAGVPNLVHVADIPSRAGLAQLQNYTEAFGAVLPKTDWRPGIGRLLGRDGSAAGPPRLGYWVRGYSFLGLPLFARKEGGYSLYLDRPGSYRVVPLGDEGLDLLARQAGGRFWQGWWFPWWRFSWGLVAPLLIAAFVWAELRWQARRRGILGLI